MLSHVGAMLGQKPIKIWALREGLRFLVFFFPKMVSRDFMEPFKHTYMHVTQRICSWESAKTWTWYIASCPRCKTQRGTCDLDHPRSKSQRGTCLLDRTGGPRASRAHVYWTTPAVQRPAGYMSIGSHPRSKSQRGTCLLDHTRGPRASGVHVYKYEGLLCGWWGGKQDCKSSNLNTSNLLQKEKQLKDPRLHKQCGLFQGLEQKGCDGMPGSDGLHL